MPVKLEKLEQVTKKILKENTDHSTLTLRMVKRAIEDELGLEEGDLEPQGLTIKDILTRLLSGDDGSPVKSTAVKRDKPDQEEGEQGDEEEPKKKKVEKPEKGEKVSAKTGAKKASAKKATEKKEGESKPGTPTAQETEDGITFWELNKVKRVTIKDWKGKTYVDLRNFFQKDGDILPTGKGVMLSKEQWEKLKEAVTQVDEKVAKII